MGTLIQMQVLEHHFLDKDANQFPVEPIMFCTEVLMSGIVMKMHFQYKYHEIKLHFFHYSLHQFYIILDVLSTCVST